ncbi:TPA: hypothetical protein RXL46_004255 [Escherichia coli]|uniref:hypothetical protein n=1 Tax=Escherichia marmotae TaxID=1499973 RepID=UPI0028136AEA|nr:hypothetical protein [Escherichia marmotae]MDQ9239371.1 hypothetical protein [Escherichia marmotae]HEA7751802.1 hypothetical protein [Escherichia coli]
MFKKLLSGFILAFAFLLSGCGGDNGELAGTYIEKNPAASDTPVKWIIKFDKKDNSYTQEIYRKFSPNGKYTNTNTNSFLSRSGDWLGGDKEKYFIRVINKNTLQFRDDENDIYIRTN